jgi:lysophospholipase
MSGIMRFSEDRLDNLLCSDKVDRCIHIWEPEKVSAVFLAIHGALSHGGDYVTPALYFKQKGIATVSYDMVGHDHKKRAHVPAFEQFLDDGELFLQWIKQQYPDIPVFVMGHSMGGLISTYLGLQRFKGEKLIKGYVLSSPFYARAVKIPAYQMFLSSALSKFLPEHKAPLQSFTHQLTHDESIAHRHLEDEVDHIRSSEMSFRFAKEVIEAQEKISPLLNEWNSPLLAVIAGSDYLSDSEGILRSLKKINPSLLTSLYYPNNYHENFNELNRLEIFEEITAWVEQCV